MSRYATNRRPGGYQERVHATLHTQAVSEDNEVYVGVHYYNVLQIL